VKRRGAQWVWRLPVFWDACKEEPQVTPEVIYVYVPYGTMLPPGARQAAIAGKAPLAITDGAP